MRVAVLFFVLGFVALAYSQVPAHCVSPVLWQGRVFLRDRAEGFTVLGEFYYDSVNQRIASIEEIDDSEGRKRVMEIQLYQNATLYRIDLDTGECEVFELTSKFRRVQIPSNATFIAEFYLGSSSVEGAGVLVEMWTGTTSFPNGRYEMLVTNKGCIPVNEIFYDFDEPQLLEIFYSNIVEGIDDPNVFVPPPQCRQ